ncbi:MAG: hypothetical protein AAB426_10685 [Myxococcota bacterium]
MPIPNIADKLIDDVRTAMIGDNFATADEVAASIGAFADSPEVCADLKQFIAQDLYDLRRPGRLGRPPAIDEGVRADLTNRFGVGLQQPIKGAFWRQPASSCARDGVTRFVNTIRADTANGRTLGGGTVDRAVRELEGAAVSDAIKSKLVEDLYRATNAQRDADGLPVSWDAARTLQQFYQERDPRNVGLDWFQKNYP